MQAPDLESDTSIIDLQPTSAMSLTCFLVQLISLIFFLPSAGSINHGDIAAPSLLVAAEGKEAQPEDANVPSNVFFTCTLHQK